MATCVREGVVALDGQNTDWQALGAWWLGAIVYIFCLRRLKPTTDVAMLAAGAACWPVSVPVQLLLAAVRALRRRNHGQPVPIVLDLPAGIASRRTAPSIALVTVVAALVALIPIETKLFTRHQGGDLRGVPTIATPGDTDLARGGERDLPDRGSTPGATSPAVTQSDIRATICVSGYTRAVRPPSAYTTALKRRQLSDPSRGYADQNLRDFEEDHLVPLELGGDPTDPRNLWPEEWAGSWGARAKDRLENELHRRVCLPSSDPDWVSLRDAQQAIAFDWIAAYRRYVDQ